MGERSVIGDEIVLCLVIACAILLFISNLGFGGAVGGRISGVLFGLFGAMAYAFPFFLFFAVAFAMANRDSSLLLRKELGLWLIFIFMSAFLQLIMEGYMKGTPLRDYYRISSEDHTGGGIVGGAIVWLSAYAFGTAGAYILTMIALVISAIILTQRPLLHDASSRGRRAARSMEERRRARKQEEKARRARGEAEDGLPQHTSADSAEELRRIIQEEITRERGRSGYAEPPADPYLPEAEYPESPDMSGLLIDGEPLEQEPAAGRRRKKAKASAAPEPAAEEFPDDGSHMPGFLRRADRARGGRQENIPESVPESVLPEETFPEGVQEELPIVREEPKPERPARKKIKTETASDTASDVKKEIDAREDAPAAPVYQFPSTDLLTQGREVAGDSRQHLKETAAKLQQTLHDFGVNVRVVNVSKGPTVTRYELQPEQGVKVSRIVGLTDDIKLNLAAEEIRIEAPIPGKAAVGIEVPNQEVSPVNLRDLLESEEFRKSRASLPFAVGKDIGGKPVIADIEKMPHMLIAGATGSGKSVCINTLIMSLLYRKSPEEVKMLMIDPKVVELKIYDGIPHLLIPVVTDAKKAAGALNWAVQEMTERYNRFAEYPGVRDIRSYNQRIDRINEALPEEEKQKRLPQIVIIVDELADLMMVASSEVEDAICRLAQLARAAGLHLIIATQRPSVNVVTGLIKANMPSRIALSVTSGVDSRTILDMNGAEKLLGKGDMLFYPQNYPKPARVQGAFVPDEDITRVVKFLTSQQNEVMYNKEVEQKISDQVQGTAAPAAGGDERDEYFAESGRLIIEKDKASIGMLQRAFKIGFNRAARIMDQLCDAGVVGAEEGTKPRKILMKAEEFEELLNQ